MADSSRIHVGDEEESCIIIINGKTYNVTAFLDKHPGGRKIIAKFNNKDATKSFDRIGHSKEARDLLQTFLVNNSALQPNASKIAINKPLNLKEDYQYQFLWYILSALVGAVAIVASTYTRTGGLWDDLARGHPKKGELGHGVFETIGYDPTTNLSYPFRLANPTVVSISTAWAGYLIHQIGQFYMIYAAKKARSEGELGWTQSGTWNPHSVRMLRFNMVFTVLHCIQSYLFYDGLSSTVPEVTAQGSVISLLVMVYILEIPRRGLILDWTPFKEKDMLKEFCQFTKRYHGYVASFGIVYDFWYHPVEATAAHLTGFFLQFLLLWQSSLLFQEDHKNRYWTLFVESFVTIHGLITAINQGGTIYLMFFFGFLGIFVLMQLWGMPCIRNYLYDEKMVRIEKRYYTVLIISVFGYLLAAGLSYFAAGQIQRLWMIVTIPLTLYSNILEFFIFYAIAYYAYPFLAKYGNPESTIFGVICYLYAFLANLVILCVYAIYFRASLEIPQLTRDFFYGKLGYK